MDWSLLISGLLIGLAGSPHCVAMCAAPCTALASRCEPQRPERAVLAWHVGRAVAYAVAGAVAAAGSGALFELARASAILKPLWSLLQAAALMLGLWLLVTGRAPYWSPAGVPRWLRARLDGQPVAMAGAGQRGAFTIEPPPASGAWRAGLAGLAWVAWPCGLLYAALSIATLASTPWRGAAVMLAFAIGSSAGLAAGSWLWWRGRGPGARALSGTTALRLTGALLAAAGVWALWQHGVAGEVQAWCLPGAARR